MNPEQLYASLNTLTLTRPITLDDTRDLYKLVKGWCPHASVDVYHLHGRQAFVTVTIDGARVRKVYDAV